MNHLGLLYLVGKIAGIDMLSASNKLEIAQSKSPLDDIRRMMNENS